MHKNLRKLNKEDYSFGLKNERELKNKIEEILKCKLVETSRYNSFDFVNALLKLYIELKSRRISKEQYSTTFVNYRKIEKINKMDSNNNFYFFFNYTNGLYYIKYDKELFDSFEKKDTFLQKRRCLLKNLLIPTNKLIKC